MTDDKTTTPPSTSDPINRWVAWSIRRHQANCDAAVEKNKLGLGRMIASFFVCGACLGVNTVLSYNANLLTQRPWSVVSFVSHVILAGFVVLGCMTVYKRMVDYRGGWIDGRLKMIKSVEQAQKVGGNMFTAFEYEMLHDLAMQGIPLEHLEQALVVWHDEHDRREP